MDILEIKILYFSRLKIKHKFKNKRGEYGELSEWSTRKKCVYVFIDFRVVIIKKGEIVETSFIASWWWIKIDSRCFDDNKDDDKKPMRMISRLSQEQFKNQEKDSRESFIKKIQDSRIIKIKIQDSKIQESREDLIKISIKKFFKTLSSTRSFHKIITKEFYSLVIDYHKVVIDYQ